MSRAALSQVLWTLVHLQSSLLYLSSPQSGDIRTLKFNLELLIKCTGEYMQ